MSERDGEERSLDAAIAGLPREREPERDLWPGIEAALAERRRRPAWQLLASAAVIACAAVIGWQVLYQAPTPDAPTVVTTPGMERPVRALPADFMAAEARFTAIREAHFDELEARLDRLPPESREAIERNLATIAAALAELRDALAEEPAEPVLQHLLLNLYTHELAVLGQLEQSTRMVDDRRIEL